MKAVQVHELTGPTNIVLADIPKPEAGPGEILIKVEAAGVTFPELLQTRGEYQVKHPIPFTLGSEGAGVVEAVGAGVDKFGPGDRVVFIAGKDSWGEYATVPADMVLPLPESVDFESGAGIPMNVLTADFALRVRGNLQPGQTLLVHGAAGGLGSALVQLGLAMGATVIGVVSSEPKAQVVRELGAQHVVFADGFKDAVKELYPHGVDLVADVVGGDRFTDSLRSLATFGTLLVLGFTAGSIPQVKVNRLLLNNISVAGVGWGAAALGRPGYLDGQWEVLLPFIEAGQLNPHIHATYPLEQAAQALTDIDDRSVRGKIILKP
jgi:NADPH2:quinone reductase